MAASHRLISADGCQVTQLEGKTPDFQSPKLEQRLLGWSVRAASQLICHIIKLETVQKVSNASKRSRSVTNEAEATSHSHPPPLSQCRCSEGLILSLWVKDNKNTQNTLNSAKGMYSTQLNAVSYVQNRTSVCEVLQICRFDPLRSSYLIIQDLDPQSHSLWVNVSSCFLPFIKPLQMFQVFIKMSEFQRHRKQTNLSHKYNKAPPVTNFSSLSI